MNEKEFSRVRLWNVPRTWFVVTELEKLGYQLQQELFKEYEFCYLEH